MEVHWSDEARDAVEAIRLRRAGFGEARANEWVQDLMRNVDYLETFPFLGRTFEPYGLEQVRELIVDQYHVLYWIAPTQVEILGVFHGRQSPFQDEVPD